jgi:hypothetical protein
MVVNQENDEVERYIKYSARDGPIRYHHNL